MGIDRGTVTRYANKARALANAAGAPPGSGGPDASLSSPDADAPTRLPIVDSTPPSGAIDARQPTDLDGSNPTGWTGAVVYFDGPAAAVVAGDFTVDTTGGVVPNTSSVVPNGSSVALTFDAFIPLQQWTRITHDPSGTSVCLGYLPGA